MMKRALKNYICKNYYKFLLFLENFIFHARALFSDHAHFDPAAHSTLRVLILVGALALHAVFEGLVFGVSQEPVSAMLGTAVAVVIHKSIIARGIRL